MIKKTIYVFIFIISLVVIGVYLVKKSPVEQTSQIKGHETEISLALDLLENAWKGGLSPFEENSCETVDRIFLKCNPHFMKCLFKKKKLLDKFQVNFPLIYENKKIPYQLIKGNDLLVELKSRSEVHRVVLKNTCKMIELPEDRYGLGPFKKEKDFIWESFEQKILIDKNLVLNWEVNEWRKYIGQEERETSKPYDVATDLTADEMEQYCLFRQKEVLSALVFDAATFYRNTNLKKRETLFRGPYPWTLKKEKLKDVKDICLKIPSKECVTKLNLRDEYLSSATWSGLFQSLGGHMEYLPNPRFPRRNLKVSSYYFKRSSSWHRLGIRGYWDGKAHDFDNFSFHRERLEDIREDIKVAFRCMRIEK